jgi:hypothetical protein
MEQQSLVASSIECYHFFCNVTVGALKKEWLQRSGLSQSAVQCASTEYMLWADTFAAFDPLPHTSSLDNRVRDHPKIAALIEELIEDLEDALRKLVAIGSGEQPSRTAGTEELVEDSEEEVEGDPSSSTVNNFEDGNISAAAKVAIRQISEAGESFGTIECTVTNLFRICNLLPKPSTTEDATHSAPGAVSGNDGSSSSH